MALPLINGESYSWGQIICNILGVPVIGITAIEYGDDQKIENNYGAGNQPVSRGFGNIEPMAKITLMMEEVEAITRATADGRLQSIPEFDIQVAYLPLNGTPVVHKIRNCRFKNNNRKTKQGATGIEVELDLIPSHIVWK